MHAENCPSVKLADELQVSSIHSGINVSILEEDLAISSSTYGINISDVLYTGNKTIMIISIVFLLKFNY